MSNHEVERTLTYKYQPLGALIDDSTGELVTLNEVREEIVNGNSIRILRNRTNEDITQEILLQMIAVESGHIGNSTEINDELATLIREKARQSGRIEQDGSNALRDDSLLVAWMKAEVGYTNVWAKDFGRRFFSLEHFSLVCHNLVCYWSNQSFEQEKAIQVMKRGTPKTRANRLDGLIEKDWLTKVHDSHDRRRFLIVPNSDFEDIAYANFSAALKVCLNLIAGYVDSDFEVSSIIEQLEETNRESVQHDYLVPFLKYLIWVSESWAVSVYSYEFSETEFFIFSTHAVISRLIGKPLTIERLAELTTLISQRRLKTIIGQGLESNLFVKSKHPKDKRVVIYSSTPTLEMQLISHYRQSLARFMNLVQEFQQNLVDKRV